ncbi:MAG: 4-(cytidine 5'-diphospho)-2-C-methyl-D-erythritol kinase [Nanoarchaeota archaeon]|nr:4-(cytidine 5'-diphospho)-2-C-methyl-D-erythritol kinase [Nanoarchaeota archaeon]
MKAYAKINLTLDVLRKREGNYHELNSVMQQINLYDELIFEKSENIIVNSEFKDDIILKTALELKELFNVNMGVKVDVKKNIPVEYGLGGGSSDAAAALIALNELWELNLSKDELINVAMEIGSDVPFFIGGRSCSVSGKGEKVEKIDMPEMNILLVNSGYGISTKEAYNELDGKEYENKESSVKLKKFSSVKEIAENIHNDFVHIQKEEVNDIINDLISNGALNASITGKGPTVFGIFENEDMAIKAYDILKDKYKFVIKTKTIV